MFEQEFTPASNYFFTFPSPEPSDAGLIRIKPEGEESFGWTPSFLLIYDNTKQLTIVDSEIEKAKKFLTCSYTHNQYDQLEFLFHLDREQLDPDLIGGLTINIEDLPAGAMSCDCWSLGLVPNHSYPALEELVSLYEFKGPLLHVR